MLEKWRTDRVTCGCDVNLRRSCLPRHRRKSKAHLAWVLDADWAFYFTTSFGCGFPGYKYPPSSSESWTMRQNKIRKNTPTSPSSFSSTLSFWPIVILPRMQRGMGSSVMTVAFLALFLMPFLFQGLVIYQASMNFLSTRASWTRIPRPLRQTFQLPSSGVLTRPISLRSSFLTPKLMTAGEKRNDGSLLGCALYILGGPRDRFTPHVTFIKDHILKASCGSRVGRYSLTAHLLLGKTKGRFPLYQLGQHVCLRF